MNKMITPPEELHPSHKERAIKLLVELGVPADMAPTNPAAMVAAYQAVLLKEIHWTMNELLIYKQQETHR